MTKVYPFSGSQEYNQAMKLAKSVAPGGGGPHDPDMEVRLAAVEFGLSEMKVTLGRIEAAIERIDDRMRKVETEMAELKGRVSQLPSTWAMITTMIGGQITLASLLFVALKVLAPH